MNIKGLITYETETKVYRTDGYTISNCNSIVFINTGTAVVTVDQVRLVAGAQFVVTGNINEINVKQYQFSFGTGINKSLTVVRKVYSNEKLQEQVYKGALLKN